MEKKEEKYDGPSKEALENAIAGKCDVKYMEALLGHPQIANSLNKPNPVLGELLLFKAARAGNFPMVKAILDKMPDLVHLRKEVSSADVLQFAVVSGNLDLVKYLLSKGADPNYRYFFETSIIYFAVKYNHLHIFRFFVEELKMDHSELLAANAIQPIYMAIEQENKEIFDYILSKNPYLENLGIHNLLGIASRVDDTYYLMQLIKRGAPFEKVEPYNRTPFAFCADDNRVRQCEILLKFAKGVKPEVVQAPGVSRVSKEYVSLCSKWWRLYDIYMVRFFSILKRKEIEGKPELKAFLEDPVLNKLYAEMIEKPGRAESILFKVPHNTFHGVMKYLDAPEVKAI